MRDLSNDRFADDDASAKPAFGARRIRGFDRIEDLIERGRPTPKMGGAQVVIDLAVDSDQ
jgi:hypothetical protein